MTREERDEAIEYIKKYRELDAKMYTVPSRNFTIISKGLVNKYLGYWDMAIKALEQEPCEDMGRKIEKEYLFESLCEDLKKLQAENENLRKALDPEPILDFIKDCKNKIENYGKDYMFTQEEVLNIIERYAIKYTKSFKRQESEEVNGR